MVARSSVLVMTLAAACQSPGVDAKTVHAEITALLQQQAGDWNRGDLERFCSVYVDDAAFLSPSGLTRGRQAILARYTKRYKQEGNTMGTLTLEVLEIHADAAGTMAATAMRWKLQWTDKDPASGLSLITLKKPNDSWMILQDASM